MDEALEAVKVEVTVKRMADDAVIHLGVVHAVAEVLAAEAVQDKVEVGNYHSFRETYGTNYNKTKYYRNNG